MQTAEAQDMNDIELGWVVWGWPAEWSASQAAPRRARPVLPLKDLQPGQKGVLVSVQLPSTQNVETVYAAGLAPSACVQVLANCDRHMRVRVGYRELGIDDQIATGIQVYPLLPLQPCED